MLARAQSVANIGVDGRLIEIECDMSSSLPGMVIVGLGGKAVSESRDRIRGAIKNSGLMIPPKRITLNLAPADLPKEGTAYDLGMAVALLRSSEQLPPDGGGLFIGELALDGSLRRVPGALTGVRLALQMNAAALYLPAANVDQITNSANVTIYPVGTLIELVNHLSDKSRLAPLVVRRRTARSKRQDWPDFNTIVGQDLGKRAALISAAGGHNLFMSGPPGSGKTLIARAMAGLLPPPDADESMEINQLYSLAGLEPPVSGRPFRSPHHSASNVALIGGGSHPKPGEISLSHHGILFLDELPEFKRAVLESLRQPLEDGSVVIGRAAGTIRYPSNFILVTAQNPCPCGFYGDPVRRCSCTIHQLNRYQNQVSGPLIDRIDLVVEMRRLDDNELTSRPNGINTSELADQVISTRKIQRRRFKSSRLNADMSPEQLLKFCELSGESKSFSMRAITKTGLSARGYSRTLKLARTIADLQHSPNITPSHLSEALAYRPRITAN
jgi:magnesium chelatase family protein